MLDESGVWIRYGAPLPRNPSVSIDCDIAKLSPKGSPSYFKISSAHYLFAFVCLELIHSGLYRDLVEIPPTSMFVAKNATIK